ncbi:MAG TPA: ATP-binding cassette domain-containing protein, partial [Lachnospira eligens]|nr:ATP-binding cassette domain-containing protein [Lachnospira eligens]
GGEKQRIAMARAIIKNSPIMIFDEATSALDNESEFLIQDTITKLKKTKTIITIAHKQATIDLADIVIEL